MRKLKNLAFAVIAITVMPFACEDEMSPDKPNQGTVQLGISSPDNQRGGANSENNMALASTIVLTLIDSEGSPIYDQKHLSLLNHNGALMAEPITLNPGNYQLTEFLVLDENGNVILATPVKGSDLDHLVGKPLPIDFSVSPDEITHVFPEVIEIRDFSLEDLGYASFQLTVVDYFTFLVTAFVDDGSTEGIELSTANITVYEAGTSKKLYEGELIDKTNKVAVVDGYEYELIFEKEGYSTLKLNFNNQELKAYSNEELKVILQKEQEEVLPSTKFVASGQSFNSSGTYVASGDLDNDGDLDLFMTRSNGLASEVWLNDGAGNFSNSGQLIGNSPATDVALGDLDGDGDLDAFISNEDNQPNTVWWNDGAAHFTNSGQMLGNFSSFFADMGDIDGDGDLDVVVGNAAGQPNNVWVNNGAGNFSIGQILGTTEAHGLDLGDVDGDGDLDIFVASLDQSDQLWFNDGNGGFTLSGQSLGKGRSVKIALVDLDGDDDLDAFVAYYRFNSAEQLSKVLLNDGNGNFYETGQELVSDNVNGLAMVDFDLDGDLDALTVSYKSEPYKLWINDGHATFNESSLPLGNHSATALTVGDFDSDGDQDFFVMHMASAHILWLGQQN